MVEVKWTNFALENLNDIGDYIEHDSPKYAEIVVNKLFGATDVLEHQPNLGRVVPEFSKEYIRELICGSYRIIYAILNEKRIDILIVQHSARLLTSLRPSE
ncbi:type II toxin-antitoxin system RelE/ParE family toxin [Pinibacter aurantiacus]|uniref:Type II toxin-antitoxin system RelE/ParE family toxin n=1 Tax=Pinibacter aurantiacus TaxID=2851599 RepID=A0A9E2W3E6_9BACT|nr:type II toxin-antitoxin system RelE/ParE family toxin [Pinibacter aurantiacus]MBV4356704.1 type II toxin-antitoxin system RelE/ParE family toxin [Pinibacter aurantiacus]